LDREGIRLKTEEWEPAVQKVYIELDMPTLSDVKADFQRIESAVGSSLIAPIDVMRSIPSVIRAARGKVTAVLWWDGLNPSGSPELLALEPGDTSRYFYAAAIDIGTTTIAGYLWNLADRTKVAVHSCSNPQAAFGADVLSRLTYAAQNEGGDVRLQEAVLRGIDEVLQELAGKAGVPVQNIYEIVLVGNTCMQHLFFRFDTRQLGLSPYIPAYQRLLSFPLKEISDHRRTIRDEGLNRGDMPQPHYTGELARPAQPDEYVSKADHLAPREQQAIAAQPDNFIRGGNAPCTFLPVIAGFVGADTVGCILATGMDRREDVTLMIDLGTNAEMVIGSKERLIACSAAAGPAFEGARIERGMRATPGAIDGVWFKERYAYHVIGGERPIGICGSGLVDVIAMLAEYGIIDEKGLIRDNPHAPEELRRRVRPQDRMSYEQARAKSQGVESETAKSQVGPFAFVLARADETGDGRDLVLTQKDIREVQLAKGAISCGIRILMKELGVTPGDISKIFLAGAFGNYIDPRSAQRIAILPAEIPLDRVVPVGNAAGVGAQMALISKAARRRADEIASRVEHLELALHPDFLEGFTRGMYF
ncbi:MAG TPA: ATP-binding protein, partial [Clostridia bacterium]|nr:ATP-binding protein [Clostridia bacterium]